MNKYTTLKEAREKFPVGGIFKIKFFYRNSYSEFKEVKVEKYHFNRENDLIVMFNPTDKPDPSGLFGFRADTFERVFKKHV